MPVSWVTSALADIADYYFRRFVVGAKIAEAQDEAAEETAVEEGKQCCASLRAEVKQWSLYGVHNRETMLAKNEGKPIRFSEYIRGKVLSANAEHFQDQTDLYGKFLDENWAMRSTQTPPIIHPDESIRRITGAFPSDQDVEQEHRLTGIRSFKISLSALFKPNQTSWLTWEQQRR
ncbi:hypothetical protein PINS_up006752 [Pythium insidiosum]|nr:hypothetical protein PINS_up006752 [Pythium insidiosum]